MDGFVITILVIIGFVILCSIRQINEYERGILFEFGKFKKVLNAG
jgi:regulator of protease activity HflC (stomatin/prohibitin superfamily)